VQCGIFCHGLATVSFFIQLETVSRHIFCWSSRAVLHRAGLNVLIRDKISFVGVGHLTAAARQMSNAHERDLVTNKDFPKGTFDLKGPKLNVLLVTRSQAGSSRWALLT